jgi:hypothetical protein
MQGKGKKQLEQKCGSDAAEIMLVHRHLHHCHHHPQVTQHQQRQHQQHQSAPPPADCHSVASESSLAPMAADSTTEILRPIPILTFDFVAFSIIIKRVASQYIPHRTVTSQYTSSPSQFFLAGSAMRANLPHMTVPNFQFTSFGSVAQPIYLLPEVPSQFTSACHLP